MKAPRLAAVCALVVFGGTFPAGAERLAVNDSFAPVGTDALPKGWCFHGWEGYKPDPALTVVPGPAPAFPAVKISGVAAPYGTNLRTLGNFSCASDDVVRISFLARGSGAAWAQCLCFTAKGGWLGTADSKPLALTPDWRAYEVELFPGVGKGRDRLGRIEIGLGGKKGLEAEFAAVSATRVKMRPGGRDATWRLVRGETFFRDDFEKDVPRVPAPAFETCDVAPGLLSKTRVGRWWTDRARDLPPLGKTRFALPSAAAVAASNACFVAGARVYGLEGEKGASLDWRFVSPDGKTAFVAALRRDPAFEDLLFTFHDGAREVGRFFVPPVALPADFELAADRTGAFSLVETSLSQSVYREFRGAADFFRVHADGFDFVQTLAPLAAGAATCVLDERFAAACTWRARSAKVPHRLDVAPAFDPVAAGWPLVFNDEFDGAAIDWNKWYIPCYCPTNLDHVSVDGKGLLHLTAGFNAKGELETGRLYSKPSFQYGYFEARLRFTRNPGWWAAFWLYSSSDVNPVVDGFEIDIFEDYYTRPKTPGGPFRKTLDHNVHVNMGRNLKSWNYNSELPGSLDDFYVIGCKWTPFEISYYLNGKLMKSEAAHSPHASVTFDAFHHCVGTAPLQAIVSGQIMHGKTLSAEDRARFPEEYLVDWVRVYGYPDGGAKAPVVRWTGCAETQQVFAAACERLRFSADVAPAAATAAPVRTVYLFDNGYLIDFKTEPPYDFEVPFNAAFYDETRWTKAGRSGVRMPFAGYPHFFTIRAQDVNGAVGTTAEPVARILRTAPSRPHGGKAQKIPGALALFDYDDGGENVAWCDTTPGNGWGGVNPREEEGVDGGGRAVSIIDSGEWIRYTVDVAEAGAYRVAADWAGASPMLENHVHVLVDDAPAGTLRMPHFESKHEGVKGRAETTLRLPAGRHALTLLFTGRFELRTLTFEKEGE